MGETQKCADVCQAQSQSIDPTISVVVPVYRAEKYLDRCVNAVLQQTFTDFELILVDDGSPDRCPALCDDWARQDTRIRVIHKENGGASTARNTGLREARGRYIAFLDSDDWIEKDMYAHLTALLEENDADICFCEWQRDNGHQKTRQPAPEKVEAWGRKKMMDRFFRINGEKSNHSICCGLYRAGFLRGFAFTEGKMNEDVIASYWFAAHSQKAMVTNRAFYHYYQNDGGVTESSFTKKNLDLLDVWEMVGADVAQNFPEYENALEMNKKRANFTLLSLMLFNGYDRHDPEMRELKKRLKASVRSDYRMLMRWKMPFSRKILMTLLVL